jgi:hypothetical protein
VTGFIVESVEEAVRAVERLPSLDRRAIRASFEGKFSAVRMTRDYEALYAKVARSTTPKLRVA